MSPSAISPDTRAVVRAVEALTTQVRRIADALSTPVVRYKVATDDGATTPPTTCSARRVKPGETMRWCIRPAHHTGKDHVDEQGYHWSDTVAVYPVDPGVVRIAHWRPASEQAAGDRQQLAGMVEAFVDAQVQEARADDEDAQRERFRRNVRNLLDRIDRRVTLTETEAALLRHHYEAEIREADTARADVARYEEVQGEMNEKGIDLARRAGRAEAAIERVRAVPEDPLGGHPPQSPDQEAYVRGWSFAIREVRAALDGTEQPTTGCVPGPDADCPHHSAEQLATEAAPKLPRLGTTED